MKLKKWLLGVTLSVCLMLNVMVMPTASAGFFDDFVTKSFPSIAALQEESGAKSSLQESVELFERWHELVDKGMTKLNEWGDLLKEKGVAMVLDHFSGQINDYVNEKAPLKIEQGYETKIVPVVTIGSKGYIGAAQISGPKDKVEQCKAALTVEGQLASGTVRIQYLVPIDTSTPASLDSIHRVQGVGVSARLDLGFPG
ncbi:MAG: hypothetical protein IJ657_03620 [Acidaminococcaceae bacterium]|nr:hypothetical protein [Acidaminococcaceae bacterium]